VARHIICAAFIVTQWGRPFNVYFLRKVVTIMAQKNHFTVVRNQANGSGAFNVRERHNERKNECYGNGDIMPERFDMNVHFRRVISPAGSPETYEQTFNRLLDEGVITKRA
jgi:hypothetical protein